ncbi:hypothetical protein ACIPD2_38980 [Streptomyces griseofuscus]|uniref:hypothetical protein n=1 Tax=Streptomyces griseofuscus TaxID=146922 RepID=UPI0038056915
MSLVRQMVAAPAGRTGDAAEPLAFDLSTNPDPLRISPTNGDAATGDLVVVASLAAETPVECRSFTVWVRMGEGEADLCQDLDGVTARISLAGWKGSADPAAGTVTFAPEPGTPAQTEVDADTGVTFQVMGVAVNQRIGLSQVDIGASWRPPGATGWQEQTTRLEIGKFPLGFHLRSFSAEPLSVPHGHPVTLRWDASAATHLSLLYDGSVHPVTGHSSVTVPAMAQTTSFQLRAVAQEGAGSVERTLSLMVHVPDPELTVGQVVVRGTLQTGQVSPASSPDTPTASAQPLPTIAATVAGLDGQGWEESHWNRSTLPVGAPAAMSFLLGTTTELVYRPLGSSGLVWSYYDGYGWSPVEEPIGDGADPAFEQFPLKLFCAHRGGAGNSQVMVRERSLPGGKWSEPVPVPGAVTAERPALATGSQGLYLAFVGTDSPARLKYTVRVGSEPWSAPQQLSGTAAFGPPAMRSFGDKLVCVHKAGNGHQVLYNRAGSTEWEQGPVLPGTSSDDGPPSLLKVDDLLYCAYRSSGRIAYVMSYDGTSWTDPSPVPGRGFAHDPALLMVKGRLCLL